MQIPLKLKGYLVLFVVSHLLSSCNNDSTEDDGMIITEENPDEIMTLERVTSFEIADFGNSGNSTDLFLRFEDLSNQVGLKHYSLVIIPDDLSFDLADTTMLSENNQYIINESSSKIEIQVNQEIKDIENNELVENIDYLAVILSIPENGVVGAVSRKVRFSLTSQPIYEVKDLTFFPRKIEALSYHPDGFIYTPGEGYIHRVSIETGVAETLDGDVTGGPLGGIVDQVTGDYYVSRYNVGEISKYDMNLNRTIVAAGLSGPTGIEINEENQLIIANYNNSTYSLVDDGQVSIYASNISGLINGPDGLVFADGELFGINFNDSKILKIEDGGRVSLFAELPGELTGYIKYYNGYFYVASISTGKVFRISKEDQSIITLAGSGISGDINGPGPLARFDQPNGIELSPSGDTIFVTSANIIKMLIRK